MEGSYFSQCTLKTAFLQASEFEAAEPIFSIPAANADNFPLCDHMISFFMLVTLTKPKHVFAVFVSQAIFAQIQQEPLLWVLHCCISVIHPRLFHLPNCKCISCTVNVLFDWLLLYLFSSSESNPSYFVSFCCFYSNCVLVSLFNI